MKIVDIDDKVLNYIEQNWVDFAYIVIFNDILKLKGEKNEDN